MAMANRDYDEKRDFIRMTIDCELTLRDQSNGQEYQGRCKNLSGSGALFHVDEAPALGSQLEIHMAPDKAVVPALDAVVEVVRVDADTTGGFLVGTTIREMRS